ncbi:hypothetical protein DOJK_01278 [Patescibacteria group bacterium]|nr:hypothetical protein DOJK_01278 [Patescibacteria group bacterium]
MKKYYLLSIVLVAALSSNAFAAKKTKNPKKTDKPAVTKPLVNDYPTRDRVEYVFNCIAQHVGNLSKMDYVTQYACGCKIDKIAEKLSFAEFEEAKTFSYLSKQAGDAGAVFRDPKQSKDLRTRLKEAEEYAEKSCFVK